MGGVSSFFFLQHLGRQRVRYICATFAIAEIRAGLTSTASRSCWYAELAALVWTLSKTAVRLERKRAFGIPKNEVSHTAAESADKTACTTSPQVAS